MALVQVIPVEAYLKSRRIYYEIAPHESTETTAAEARVLGIPPRDVLKAVLLRIDDAYALAIIPASERLDLHLLDRAAGAHVRLANEAEIQAHFPDFELGAIPPIPGVLGVKGYVDPSVLEHDEVAFADGRRTESMIASARELLWGEDVIVAPILRRPAPAWQFEGDSLEVTGGGW